VLEAVPADRAETAVAYLDETPYRQGEPVPLDGRTVPAEEELYLGFVDCEAGRNWGHECVYVRCGAGGVSVDTGSLPPQPLLQGSGRRLAVLSVGPRVPAWAVA
jgi:hypothetical protein